MRTASALLVLSVLLVACGAPSAPESPAGASATTPEPATTKAASARPSCDAIDEACDAHDHASGKAKECHDLGEAAASTEDACAAKKAECFAVCPPASK